MLICGSQETGITYNEYIEYYKEHDNAYGIEISNVQIFSENPIKLSYLKAIIPGFAPPQTYKYFATDIISNSILSEIIV